MHNADPLEGSLSGQNHVAACTNSDVGLDWILHVGVGVLPAFSAARYVSHVSILVCVFTRPDCRFL